MALALQGLVQALIVLAYVLIYQQVENYWLSPKLSAKTMTSTVGWPSGPPWPAVRLPARWAPSWPCRSQR